MFIIKRFYPLGSLCISQWLVLSTHIWLVPSTHIWLVPSTHIWLVPAWLWPWISSVRTFVNFLKETPIPKNWELFPLPSIWECCEKQSQGSFKSSSLGAGSCSRGQGGSGSINIDDLSSAPSFSWMNWYSRKGPVMEDVSAWPINIYHCWFLWLDVGSCMGIEIGSQAGGELIPTPLHWSRQMAPCLTAEMAEAQAGAVLNRFLRATFSSLKNLYL